MPRGLTDDSVEAAAWLVSERPMLIVDGYNVSMAAWPDAEIAEQRRRVAQLLADLVARSPGLTVELVFDGDSAEGAPAAPPARLGVNVRFSAADVEADDVVLEMIGRYPIERAVVVASSDRRVRDGARRRGANVVSAHQLLAVARS
jgi:predicted RNA-binding protein with PIN domain